MNATTITNRKRTHPRHPDGPHRYSKHTNNTTLLSHTLNPMDAGEVWTLKLNNPTQQNYLETTRNRHHLRAVSRVRLVTGMYIQTSGSYFATTIHSNQTQSGIFPALRIFARLKTFQPLAGTRRQPCARCSLQRLPHKQDLEAGNLRLSATGSSVPKRPYSSCPFCSGTGWNSNLYRSKLVILLALLAPQYQHAEPE